MIKFFIKKYIIAIFFLVCALLSFNGIYLSRGPSGNGFEHTYQDAYEQGYMFIIVSLVIFLLIKFEKKK